MDVYSKSDIFRIMGHISTLIPELHKVDSGILLAATEKALNEIDPMDEDPDFEFKEERTFMLEYIDFLEDTVEDYGRKING